MSIFTNIFHRKKADDDVRVGGVEDFMTLIRVYFQATMAANLGITNIAMLPDLRVFKHTLAVPTLNNRLGQGEKNRCKKMLVELYDMPDLFFKEIDQSVKSRCRRINDVQSYMALFQAFSQELMMLMGNVLKWKLRMPSVFKKTIKSVIEKQVNDLLVKTDWKDDAVRRSCAELRKYQHTLGYSPAWMTEYTYRIVMLAKKEPRPKDVDEGDKK